ncbi:hypothetical protein [Fusibacter tunisiensis]|uniref:DUF3899 domain-containing protein n=1 Tax=Fusibacter tunisiensis TaxID=1008308 RepID=A0ABS2MSS1_9FIRM|nr:hypothetical protein [Fusibacter tunisiensis]MBM7562483.1 hypothetical protein [Fusibacter tunisiensis]
MRCLKRYRTVLFLLVIQAIFAIKTRNFELYFFAWGLIWAACLANTTFGISRFTKGMDGAVNSARSYEVQASAFSEVHGDPDHYNKNYNERSMQVIYGVLVLTNIVGYIITVKVVY